MSAQIAVHPRACREHRTQTGGKMVPCGSSPRMQGTPRRFYQAQPTPRFIPAHAGNTCPSAVGADWSAVHPRACREHVNLKSELYLPSGSSPRMQGTRALAGIVAGCDRFIPAHAGNTVIRYKLSGVATVHPRACREHLARLNTGIRYFGSSPRMQGTR